MKPYGNQLNFEKKVSYENKKNSKIRLFKNQSNKEEATSIIFARTVNDFKII